MTKTKLFAVLLAGAVCISLAGCGNQPKPPAESVPGSTVTADVTSGIDTSDVIPAEPTAPEESEPPAESSASEPQQPAEKEKSEAEPASEQTKRPIQTEPQEPAEPTEPQQPQEPPAAQTQPVQPQTPAPQEPALTEPEPSAEPPQESAEIKPEFNINDWIDYAKNYAVSVGLRLESSAVDCWDNPITAGAHSSCLQRDIESRLNRYSRDEDITDVWIWAEKSSDGSYDLYIGYA